MYIIQSLIIVTYLLLVWPEYVRSTYFVPIFASTMQNYHIYSKLYIYHLLVTNLCIDSCLGYSVGYTHFCVGSMATHFFASLFYRATNTKTTPQAKQESNHGIGSRPTKRRLPLNNETIESQSNGASHRAHPRRQCRAAATIPQPSVSRRRHCQDSGSAAAAAALSALPIATDITHHHSPLVDIAPEACLGCIPSMSAPVG